MRQDYDTIDPAYQPYSFGQVLSKQQFAVLFFTLGFRTAFGFPGSCSTTRGGSTILIIAARFGVGFASTIYWDASGSIAASTPTTVSVLSKAVGFDNILALAFVLGGGSGSLTSSNLTYSTSSFSVFAFKYCFSNIHLGCVIINAYNFYFFSAL